ncbi:MBL fold metallo-hydrolase [Sphaerisporangium siamense]|uniref:Cyclase n=1 Tax=Sphaerisporangium siamense TaxID=795645 RepID=A0A7W7D3V4_9ACTN|nr:MBL fold metallo-hydrolase [Sphaerisporangium siamense]MBB4698870.1 cyclase [Sphaerisporangium siamense]GII89056.1 MBL fold metallo-hydrolase [Sphaerisporangium siamense]
MTPDPCARPEPDSPGLREIVPGVLAWTQPDGSWWLNNAGVVTGGGEALLVDTCATEPRTRRFLAAVREATADAPIRLAVNTHQHGDHTYGNSLLPASTVIIGHAAMREALRTDPIIDGCPPIWSPVPDWGAVTRRVPDIAMREELTVHVGDRRVELRHPGFSAHTPGDVVAWLPEERVLFTGDLIFHGLTPLVLMGSVPGALRSLDWMAAFEPEHVVPGHGPVLDAAALPEVLAAHERYYRLVLETAERGRAEGRTPLEAARACDLGEFASWADAERLVLNLHRAYADLAGGGEPDVLVAFGDAVAFHGGPLPTFV